MKKATKQPAASEWLTDDEEDNWSSEEDDTKMLKNDPEWQSGRTPGEMTYVGVPSLQHCNFLNSK